MPAILVVEDHKDTAFAIRTLLQLEGYDVDEAASGEQALDKLAGGTFDLVILDLILPDISGYDVARVLREKRQRVPIIAVSARDTVDASQFDDCVPKPFDTDVLLERVRNQIGQA